MDQISKMTRASKYKGRGDMGLGTTRIFVCCRYNANEQIKVKLISLMYYKKNNVNLSLRVKNSFFLQYHD